MTEYVEICVLYEHHTDRAVLVKDGDRKVWIPRSQIKGDEDFDLVEEGAAITLDVSEWFANKEGLI